MARTLLGQRAAVSVIIDGRAIDNLGQDVPITTTFPDNQSTTVMGINGSMTKTSNTTLCELTTGLLPNSLGNDVLWELYYNQRGVFGRLFDISIISDVNANLQYKECTIKQAPELSIGGEDIANYEWVFNVGLFIPDKSLFGGVLNG
jgi:hypothetical protein